MPLLLLAAGPDPYRSTARPAEQTTNQSLFHDVCTDARVDPQSAGHRVGALRGNACSRLYAIRAWLRSDAVEFNDRHASCMRHWPSHRSDIPWCHGKSETRHATHAKYITIILNTHARGAGRRHVPREPPIVNSRVRFYYSKRQHAARHTPGQRPSLSPSPRE